MTETSSKQPSVNVLCRCMHRPVHGIAIIWFATHIRHRRRV